MLIDPSKSMTKNVKFINQVRSFIKTVISIHESQWEKTTTTTKMLI